MIDPISGIALEEALAGLTAGMLGQTIDDAYNQYITGQYPTNNGPTIGFANYTSNQPAISGDTSGSIPSVQGATPVDAWNDYIENTPTATVSGQTGGIVSGSKIDTFVYSLMEENPGTATAAVRAVAPVAVPIQAAVVGVCQALGVSMNISEVASDVKDTIINSIKDTAGVIYDAAKGTVTAWRDELGRILFPKSIVDSVADALDEEGIHPGSGGVISDLSIPNATMPLTFGENNYASRTDMGGERTLKETAIGRCALLRTAYNSASLTWVVVSDSSGDVDYKVDSNSYTGNVYVRSTPTTNSYTYNGRTVYYTTVTETGMGSYRGQYNEVTTISNIDKIAWTLLYGTLTGDLPEGMSTSEAPSYTPSTIPSAGNVATSYDPDTGILGSEEVVPIQLTEDPYDSTGSTADPIDPTDEDNPGVVNPPIPLPIPDTKPSNPEVPLVNPTVVDYELVNELVDELANTLDPQAPQSSGLIPVPPLPGIYDPDTGQTTFPSIIPQSGPGFIHVYNPTPAEFVAFGTWLWVTYADATIDKILNNPFDGVIGAHELYATPNRDGRDNIRSAFLTCPTTADLVTNRYSEIDCGTVIVPEFYGNYLDYSPYSQAYIYLPFIGINEVSIDDIVGHAVNIRYRIDSYSGSCIAMIFVAKDGYQNLCYQFAGSCSVEVPMAGGSQAAIKAGMMQAEAYARAAMIQAGANAFGALGSTMMGNIGGVLSSLSGIASNYAQSQAGVEAARVANKSSVQHSGQFGASHGAMGEKVPFIIVRNPVQIKVVNYNEDYGFPAHKRVIVGGCRGYLRVREVNVISAHATDEEKMAIEMALKGGVYVS